MRAVATRRRIGDPEIELKGPLPLARTSSAQATISFGCISNAPQAPRLPAFIIAIDKDGGQAPAIGASKIGSFKPKRLQKASARPWSRDIVLSLRLPAILRNAGPVDRDPSIKA